jgi:hypothetical protein
MKILNSSTVSSFGGINFVLEELTKIGIGDLLNKELPELSAQCKYSWKDLLFAYWSVLFCGGDCAEDLSINLKPGLKRNPFVNVPSPDRILDRLKELSEPSESFKKNRSDVFNEFSINKNLNALNIKVLKKTKGLKGDDLTLDYDNTFIYTKKADAKRTYTKNIGYCPGVGIIGNNIVYVENRNGNCAPHTLQDETLERMFQLLADHKIKVKAFRADSASYQFSTINTVTKYTERLYIKAVANEAICEAINKIEEWAEIEVDGQTYWRGSVKFTPFKNTARRTKTKELLKEYRLVVTKEKRRDGQLNLFTGEACIYSPILTNDFDKTDDEVVNFYNQRGKEEREFDVMKNDFAWNKLPFSKMEQNTVFLIITAMCRNLYDYIITRFSKIYSGLQPWFRIKKFIFRFICIPAKWITTGRQEILRLYGEVAMKT